MSTIIEQIKAKHPNIKSHDAEDLRTINEALEGLFKRGTFASRDPYILTIPQEAEFSYKHRNVYQTVQFAHGTPFSGQHEREIIQYQTYRYYEPGTTLFKQFPSTMEDVPHPAQKKAPATVPKKVMSLSAYKKHKLGSSPTPREKEYMPVHADAEVEQTKAESADILASLGNTEHDDVAPGVHEAASNEVKRKRDELGEGLQGNGQGISDTSRRRSRTPNDIRRMAENSPSPLPNHDAADTSEDYSRARPAVQDRPLPEKLSPLRNRLPDRLSPTLPDAVECALQERRDLRPNRKSATSLNDTRKPVATLSKIETSPHQASARPGKTSNAKRATSDGDDDLVTEEPPQKRSKVDKDRSQHDRAHSDLKAPRKNAPPDISSPSVQPKPKVADQTSSVKSKDRPHTPVNGAATTPSTQKSLLSTPSTKKVLTNGATRTPSNDANTPVADGSVKQVSKSTRSSVQKAWAAEQKRFEDVGRDFKHAASACATASPPQPQLAAVRALASMMCYLLGFTCADQIALTAEPKQAPPLHPWRSLEPFYKFVRGHCKPYPSLTGLAGMLGQSFSAHILELLEVSPTDATPREKIVDITALMRRAAKESKSHLDARSMRIDFPQSWKVAIKHGTIEDNLAVGKLLQGDFPLPVDLLTTPVQAVRASLAILEEWIANEGLGEKIVLEPAK